MFAFDAALAIGLVPLAIGVVALLVLWPEKGTPR